MQNQTKDQLELLIHLTDAIENSQVKEEIKYLIAKAAVVSAYLKRRNNLIFISEEMKSLSASELEYCLKESIFNIKLMGKICEMKVNLSGALTFEQITAAYDAFEKAIEFFIDDFTMLFVTANNNNEVLTCSVL